ncbi:MAG: hypothetical protein ABFD04_00140 [Syntrophomonas sp.]
MEKKQFESVRNKRRPKGTLSPYNINFLHLRSSWVMIWWAASYLGFAYVSLGAYIKGFILIFLEFFLNVQAKLNLGIFYSLTGQFDMAKQVLDTKWLLFYVPIYVAIMWGASRTATDLNKYSILADREESVVFPFAMNSLDIAFLDKRNPWLAVVLSLLAPGLGHLYTHRVVTTSFLIMFWWLVTAVKSSFFQCVHLTATGHFAQAIAVSDPQWLLFLPSIYVYAIHDSYINTIHYNQLHSQEQQRYLIDNYQNANFPMPTR